MMSLTFLTEVTIWLSVCPDCVTRVEPSSTFLTESWINSLISFAAVAERPARLRDLCGNDSEATTLLARARRLDSGIQCQQVCLECNLIDDADDVGDLLRRLVDLGHGAHGFANHRAAFFSLVARGGRELICLARVVRILLDRGGHLLHGGGRLLQRG